MIRQPGAMGGAFRVRVLVISLVLATSVASASAVDAQAPIAWGEPRQLSLDNQNALYPAIVADAYGFVHVFWSHYVDEDVVEGQSATQYLAHILWDGYNWTSPNEVLMSPSEQLVEYPVVALDSEQTIHVVWSGQSNYYYSYAPALSAERPGAWATPIPIASDSARSLWSAAIATRGTEVHVAYETKGGSGRVYHVSSPDRGATWTNAVPISDRLRSEETSLSNVKIVADAEGALHVVWQANDDAGFGQAIYYSRSVDRGVTWARPFAMARRGPNDDWATYPYIGVVQDALIMTYAFSTNVGRMERRSTDGGVSWSDAISILDELEGINGYTIPLQDASGALHLAINMRAGEDQRTGIYWSDAVNGAWTRAVAVDIDSAGAPTAHYLDATVLLGNQVHLVYNSLGRDEIWHVAGTLQSVAPILAVAPPLPTPASTYRPTPVKVAEAASDAEAWGFPTQTGPVESTGLGALSVFLLSALLTAAACAMAIAVSVRRRR